MNPRTIQFKIVTPEKTVYSDEIDQVTIPTQDGEITVLYNHTPLLSLIKPGELTVSKEGQQHYFFVAGGFAQIRPHGTVVILADTSERSDEIDGQKAEEARQRVEEIMKKHDDRNNKDFARFETQLERELARINIAQNRRGRR